MLNHGKLETFKCSQCSKSDQQARGCIRPIKTGHVWEIDECVICEGKNEDCPYCGGRGRILVRQCPRSVAKRFQLLPFFHEYKGSNGIAWPDGRGRLYQPLKLVTAFDIMSHYSHKIELQKIKNPGGK